MSLKPFLEALRNRQPYRPPAGKDSVIGNLNDGGSSEASSNGGDGAGNGVAAGSGGNSWGFEKLFAAAAKNDGEIYLLVPGGNGDSLEYRQEQRFASDWAKSASGYSIKNATPIFAELRLRKSPYELALMRHAIDITTEAHERAWVAAGNAKWEYEVDAQVAYTFKLRNADHWGYPSIVGCGPNATTLHYEESQGQVRPGELLLMDVGAEYDHYSADVTRTFPVNGKFSPAQAEIYQIVYDAQEAAAKASRPGATMSDVHRAAAEVIKDGLLEVGPDHRSQLRAISDLVYARHISLAGNERARRRQLRNEVGTGYGLHERTRHLYPAGCAGKFAEDGAERKIHRRRYGRHLKNTKTSACASKTMMLVTAW